MKARVDIVHTRTTKRTFDRHELTKLLADAVSKEAGISPRGATVRVTFVEETEGSPPYRVGTRANVEIVEDLNPTVADAPLAVAS